eukprot:1193115-Prorocentrum_minimum.AAC.3
MQHPPHGRARISSQHTHWPSGCHLLSTLHRHMDATPRIPPIHSSDTFLEPNPPGLRLSGRLAHSVKSSVLGKKPPATASTSASASCGLWPTILYSLSLSLSSLTLSLSSSTLSSSPSYASFLCFFRFGRQAAASPTRSGPVSKAKRKRRKSPSRGEETPGLTNTALGCVRVCGHSALSPTTHPPSGAKRQRGRLFCLSFCSASSRRRERHERRAACRSLHLKQSREVSRRAAPLVPPCSLPPSSLLASLLGVYWAAPYISSSREGVVSRSLPLAPPCSLPSLPSLLVRLFTSFTS